MTQSPGFDAVSVSLDVYPNPTVVHDADGAVLAANSSGREVLGAELRLLDGRLPWELGPDDDRADVDLQVRMRDGADRWYIASARRVALDGRTSIITSLVDVTERHRWAVSAIEGVVQRFQLSWAGSHLPVFLVQIDEEHLGEILVSNPSLQALAGSVTAMNGRHLSEVFDMPGTVGRQAVDDLVRDLMVAEGGGPAVTSRIRCDDGSTRPVLLGLTVARGPLGRALFLLGYAIDQTPLEELEAARRQDLAHTELIYEYGSDVVVVVTAEGEFRFVGPSSIDVLGYDRRELIGRVGFDLIHPDDRELAMEALANTAARPGLAPPLHVRIRDGYDEWRPVEMVARNLLGVPDIDGVVVTIRDRTDQERVEAELERSERQMRALVGALPDLVFRFDRDGTYLDVHSVDDSLLAMPREEFLGRPLAEVLDEAMAPGVADLILGAIDEVTGTGRTVAVDYELELATGVRQFEARLALINADEVLAVVRDTTDLHRSEQRRVEHERELVRQQAVLERSSLERELERASRIEAMGYLAATMAHDVNNLLGVVNNYASAIRHSASEPSVRRSAQEISAAVGRGAALTQHLLQVGRRPSAPHLVESVRDLVADLSDSLRGAFDRDGGAELLTELPDDPALVRGSRSRIEQAVMNLVLNARDAAEAVGGEAAVSLSVDVRRPAPAAWRPDGLGPGEYVVISVVDGAGGIPEQVKGRIFEPFFSTKDGTNSGLGLPIVRDVAEQHRGGVGIHAVEVDGVRGTRMELWLPSATDVDPDGPASSPGDRPVDVLLVDDDEDVRRSTRQLLERLGHRVVDVGDAASAIALVASGEQVDVVLSDVRMPEVPGPELVRRLRRLLPGLDAVFVTGYADDLAGAHDLQDVPVLRKPYTVEQLAELIGRGVRSG